MNIDDLKFFYCYDKGLMEELKRKGHRYITKAIHPVSRNLFAVYIFTDELRKQIDIWNKFK
ncbi:hypothetical protein [Priestia flexa]|uniref:hypothetical protein n=1 Tax=Priestia flexa TaxID=86664 RepID=UPI0004740DD3|nr:hypothetical protein [Priestia flexa]